MTMYKNIIRTAFLFATGICLTACSSGDDELADSRTIVTPDTKENTVTLTGTISTGSDITRAVDDTDGKTVYWEAGDEICVQYTDKDGNYATVKGKITEVKSADTHDAKFEATLINLNASETSLNIGLAYPYSNVIAGKETSVTNFAIDETKLAKQAGTIAGINDAKLDIAWTETEVPITINWTKATATLNNDAELSNQVCICKFNVTDDVSGPALDARALEITLGDNTTPDYIVIPDNDLSTFYVALPAISDTKLKIEASTCGGNGAMVLDSEDIIKSMKSTDVGSYISVDASNQAYLCTDLTSSSNSTAKICKHTYSSSTKLLKGKFYELDLAATSQGLTPIAVVASVGEVSNYWSKFLALALNDISTTNVSTIAEAQQAAQDWVDDHTIKIAGNTYDDMYNHNYDEVKPNVNKTEGVADNAKDQEAYNPSNTSTSLHQGWRVPSVTDWRYVIQGLGGSTISTGPSATTPKGIGDHNFVYSGTTSGYAGGINVRDNINTKCGNSELHLQYYWSSSYYQYDSTTKKPWRFNFDTNRFEWNSGDDMSYIRAVFAY